MMKRTIGLFGTAASLLVGAVILDLWPSGKPVTLRDPPPPPKVVPPPPPPVAATPGTTAEMGELVRLSATFSNGYLRAGAENELFLKMDLDAKEVQAGQRQPMALAIVLDRSGSMAGEKIAKAREAAKQLVDRLNDDDRIAVVSYATDTSIDLPLTRVTPSERARIRSLVDQIFDGGGTNLSGGLEAGLTQLRSAASEGMISRLVLLSDGNANQGITEPRRIAQIAQQARMAGTTISTLGVGLDFNEDLMTLIAESAGGNYYYARNATSIVDALDNEFKGLIRLAARRVEIGLELSNGASIREVYGYRTELRRGRVVIPVGDMHSGQHRKVVVRLAVPGGSEGVSERTTISLSYASPEGSDREFQGLLSLVTTSDELQIKSNERRDVIEAAETALAATERTKAVRAFEEGKRSNAIQILRGQLEKTRKRASSLGSSVLSQQAQEMEQALEGLKSLDAASDQGKDHIKSEKFKARAANIY